MKKSYVSRNSLRKSVLFFIFYFLFSSVGAQNFTQRIQQKEAGKGTVTIHQTDSINYLVNKAVLGLAATATTTTTNPAANGTADAESKSKQPTSLTATDTSAEEEKEPAPVDMTKKMMRNSYKINGYRVQVYAGGNSRKDRQQAEQTGNSVKVSFPETPVYVHFYSPRWICRVGNYRTYEEAHQMLISLRKMGFSQATIVKGKISVQY